MKILITGGHVTPALAVIDQLQKKYPDIKILFVGRKYTSPNEHTSSYEYNEITKKNIPFIELNTGRFTRILSLRNIMNILKIPLGFVGAFQILRHEHPNVILSFGGYIAFPIAIIGFLLKIPVYTHEQTIHPGLANKTIARVALKIFVAFEQAQKYFSKNKVIVTGNPLRKAIFKVDDISLIPKSNLPIIYITGGSLGSHAINSHILQILPQLLKKYVVIHQVGDVREYADFEKHKVFVDTLSKEYKERYILYKHIYDSYIGYIYAKTDLVIARAGANTFFELITLQKPMIFIPLPWSANGEQHAHAKIAERAGIGEIFDQYDKSENLLNLINSMIGNIKKYEKNFHKFAKMRNHHAEDIIINTILAAQQP